MTPPFLLWPLLALLTLLGSATAGFAQALPALPPLQSEVLSDHPLSGRIYRAGTAEPYAPEQLVAALAAAPFVLLGEKHDNPDHHALQAWMIRALAAAGRRPALVMEMISLDQAPALAAFLAQPGRDAAAFGPALGWEKSGWPPWPIYQPIAAAAFAHGLALVPGDLDRATIRTIGRQGLAQVSPDLRARLALEREYAPDAAVSLRRELLDSHCGRLPEAALARMSDVQRSRDAFMARQLVDVGTTDGAILIAGGGHVRSDRAVPWHLTHMAPGRDVRTLGFQEVVRERTDPRHYGIDSDSGRAIFDYVWLTPRVDEADPCDTNREELERLRQRP